MSFPRKITSALAWVGLAIVIAVPVVEMVRSKFVSNGAPEVAPVAEAQARPVAKPAAIAEAQPVIAPVVVAPVKPVVQPTPTPVASSPPVVRAVAPVAEATEQTPAAADAAPAGDAVTDYLATNKTLPSYITPSSSAKATAESQPAPTTPAAQQLATNLASAPSTSETAAVASSPASVSADSADQTESTAVATADTQVTAPASAPVPMPASARPKVVAGQTVTEADLKDWKSGTLEDYLRQHNLLANSSPDQGDGN